MTTTIDTEGRLSEDRLSAFLHRFVGDPGATVHAANVVIGDKLGLYKVLAAAGSSTPDELAERTGTRGRYVAEWLAGQAAGGYVGARAIRRVLDLWPEDETRGRSDAPERLDVPRTPGRT